MRAGPAMEWLFREPQPESAHVPQPYGDLAALNTERVVADAVGDMLARYRRRLPGCARNVHRNLREERRLRVRSAAFRLVPAARPGIARDVRNGGQPRGAEIGPVDLPRGVLAVGARRRIETGQPADMECAGGIRLYAVPILAGGEAVGSMNFGYGNPPEDAAKLAAIAAQFGWRWSGCAKRRAATARGRRPSSKAPRSGSCVSARLAGALVERKRAEEAAQRAAERVSRLHTMAAALSEAVTTEQVLDTDHAARDRGGGRGRRSAGAA